MSEKTSVKARVTATLEVLVPDSWGGDCLLDQVRKQATESALNILLKEPIWRNAVKIIGQPIVTAILVDDDR